MKHFYLTCVGGSMELPEGDSLVGRSSSCRLRISDPGVSREHVLIRVRNNLVTVEDLASHNGTFINGERISGDPVVLSNGDELELSGRRFRLLVTEDEYGDRIPTVSRNSRAQVPATIPGGTPPEPEDWLGAECPDRRSAPRFRVNVPVRYASPNLTFESLAVNLSRSGIFIKTPRLDETGAACTVNPLIGSGSVLHLSGKVARVVAAVREPGGDLGLGIEFRDVSDTARQWLGRTLERAITAA